ncbi:N-6 DNA methylase [Frateuria sp. STR12]|nr:type ISP restriction/modification enzyme [Frateuria sp. STR12]MCX7514262.1 N-6 DNA methylase [Frateuria sp. STR12]
MTERLGIVYTPVEVVDFILHSVAHLLQTEFGQTLGSKGVHILDPFTGTGTFITRLLQSGLITPEQLPHKYRHEIHANEIVLLAYYIAAINIEAVYHGVVGGEYEPFEGICLTDTFQMYEKDDLVDALLVDNSARRKRQKKLDIRVIVGNPPYSIGQGSQNDNNQNIKYPLLDRRIEQSYAAQSRAALSRGLYDSYIRAIRWATDRIGDAGIVGFVTNAGFLETTSADGLRKCLAEEFSNIHVFHLRGNQRTSGELSRREGGKIFGSGSRAPIAITLLVKNPQAAKHGLINYHDIGDYLTREQKLEKIARYASVEGITDWRTIVPDAHGDWLRQRQDGFEKFIVLGDKRGNSPKVFESFSMGVVTNRDAWAYNASRDMLALNMRRMIDSYNDELVRFNHFHQGLDRKARERGVDAFIDTNPERISWTVNLKQDLIRGRTFSFDAESLTPSLYRPFSKQWMYFNSAFNERVLQMPRIFPNVKARNLAIMTKGNWRGDGHFALMIDHIPCLLPDGGAQCFPLYLYDSAEKNEVGTEKLFADQGCGPIKRRDAISDVGLLHFQQAYPRDGLINRRATTHA